MWMLIGNFCLPLSCCFFTNFQGVCLRFFFNFGFFLFSFLSVLHTIFFSFLKQKIKHWFLFKSYFKALYILIFLQCLRQSKLISNKAAADRVSLISAFPFKATGPSVHTVLPQADSRKAMACAVVRGWRPTWRSTNNSDVLGSSARGRNGWIACVQPPVLYPFLGLEGENRAMYKTSEFPLCSSSFSAVRAKVKLAGADGKGRGCVISFEK